MEGESLLILVLVGILIYYINKTNDDNDNNTNRYNYT